MIRGSIMSELVPTPSTWAVGEITHMASTPAHVTSATLGNTSASSVLNETFMSTKKSLDKQDKLDFISFNLDLERDFNIICQEWGCHDVHGWQSLLSWLAWGLVLFSFQAGSVNVITMSELQNNTISGELKLRIEKSSHIPLAPAELWNCHECNKS